MSAGFNATGGNRRHPKRDHVSNHKTKNTSCFTERAVANENGPWFMAYGPDRDISNETPIDEDRAALMSLIISDKTVLQENPGMTEKMRYYAACIRDCFDTAGWPETTLWEYVP